MYGDNDYVEKNVSRFLGSHGKQVREAAAENKEREAQKNPEANEDLVNKLKAAFNKTGKATVTTKTVTPTMSEEDKVRDMNARETFGKGWQQLKNEEEDSIVTREKYLKENIAKRKEANAAKTKRNKQVSSDIKKYRNDIMLGSDAVRLKRVMADKHEYDPRLRGILENMDIKYNLDSQGNRIPEDDEDTPVVRLRDTSPLDGKRYTKRDVELGRVEPEVYNDWLEMLNNKDNRLRRVEKFREKNGDNWVDSYMFSDNPDVDLSKDAYYDWRENNPGSTDGYKTWRKNQLEPATEEDYNAWKAGKPVQETVHTVGIPTNVVDSWKRAGYGKALSAIFSKAGLNDEDRQRLYNCMDKKYNVRLGQLLSQGKFDENGLSFEEEPGFKDHTDLYNDLKKQGDDLSLPEKLYLALYEKAGYDAEDEVDDLIYRDYDRELADYYAAHRKEINKAKDAPFKKAFAKGNGVRKYEKENLPGGNYKFSGSGGGTGNASYVAKLGKDDKGKYFEVYTYNKNDVGGIGLPLFNTFEKDTDENGNPISTNKRDNVRYHSKDGKIYYENPSDIDNYFKGALLDNAQIEGKRDMRGVFEAYKAMGLKDIFGDLGEDLTGKHLNNLDMFNTIKGKFTNGKEYSINDYTNGAHIYDKISESGEDLNEAVKALTPEERNALDAFISAEDSEADKSVLNEMKAKKEKMMLNVAKQLYRKYGSLVDVSDNAIYEEGKLPEGAIDYLTNEGVLNPREDLNKKDPRVTRIDARFKAAMANDELNITEGTDSFIFALPGYKPGDWIMTIDKAYAVDLLGSGEDLDLDKLDPLSNPNIHYIQTAKPLTEKQLNFARSRAGLGKVHAKSKLYKVANPNAEMHDPMTDDENLDDMRDVIQTANPSAKGWLVSRATTEKQRQKELEDYLESLRKEREAKTTGVTLTDAQREKNRKIIEKTTVKPSSTIIENAMRGRY